MMFVPARVGGDLAAHPGLVRVGLLSDVVIVLAEVALTALKLAEAGRGGDVLSGRGPTYLATRITRPRPGQPA